jgi:hypothetical protein
MQYILTQQEYDELTREKRLRTEEQDRELLEICIMTALHAPARNAGSDSRPWGCVLAPIPQQRAPYCDDCPAQRVCPSKDKEWSQ